ncbi:MAG: tyrosine-type recombinase/integrase [Mangrovibacterium sp.]
MGASAKVLLFKSKKYKDGKHPVLLRIVIDRKPMYYNIGNNLKCIPDQWDEKTSLFEKSFPNYKEANRNVLSALGKANEILINLNYENPNFGHGDFKQRFIRKGQKIYLLKYMDEIISRLKKAGKVGNVAAYESTKKKMESHFEKDVELGEISSKVLTMFIEACQGEGLKPNTIGFYLRTLRAVYNKAIKEEGFEYYPFKNFNWKTLKNKTPKRAIPKDDVKRIIHFEAKEGTALFHARQLFTFQYLTYGLNFADLAKITNSSISKAEDAYILSYERSKGGKLYEIPLNEQSLEILEYYKRTNTGTGYIFPVLNKHIHVTPEQIKTRIKTALKKYNSDLRTIGKELKIPIKLTSYVTRHTFASVLAKAGTSVFTIGDMLGHSDLKTTQIYLKELDYSEKIEASKNLTD